MQYPSRMAGIKAPGGAVIISWLVAIISIAAAVTFGVFWQSAAQEKADAEATVVELKGELDGLG